MEQHIIIALLFLGALFFLGRMIFKSFTTKGCTSGCASCGIDFDKIEKDLQMEKELQKKRLS